MMSTIEAPVLSVLQAHARSQERLDHQDMGRRLGHMRGTEEGPPGLRPSRMEQRWFVEGARRGDETDAVQPRVTEQSAAAMFDGADGDGDGTLSRSEFFSFTEMAVRDGLATLLARFDVGNDGETDGAGDGVGDGAGDDAVVAAPPADDGAADGADEAVVAAPVDEAPAIAVDPETPEIAAAPQAPAAPVAPEAPAAVSSGDPVFDLTIGGAAERFVEDAAEAALALLEAAAGYSEAAGTA